MFSSHGMVLDVDQMLAMFSSATITRGLQYQREGRISAIAWIDDGLALTGRCSGSGNNVYVVTASFAPVPAGLRLRLAHCSCPVSVYCKHAAALLLAADSSHSRRPGADRWRTVLSKVLDEIAPPARGNGSPIGLRFSLAGPVRYRHGAAIALRPVTIGKRGTWVKTGLSWQRLVYNADAGEFDPRQYDAVRRLGTEVQRSRIVSVAELMTISHVSQGFWAQLDAAVDAGVTLVAADDLVAIDIVKSAQLRLDFASDGSGGAAMSAVACRPHVRRGRGAVR